MQATQIQYNSDMIEDYALTVWPPVAQNVQGSFLTLQNAMNGTPVTELLTVSNQNKLLHFSAIRARTPDGVRSSGWAFGFAPILLKIAFTTLSSVKADPRFVQVVGPIAISIFGAGLLGIGVWTTVEQALDSNYRNGWIETRNIIIPIPTSCAWLLALTDETEGLSAEFLVGIAAVCDLGGGLVTTVAWEASST